MNNLAVCITNDNKTVTPYETIDAVVNAGFKNVFIQWYDQNFEVSQEEQLKYIKSKNLNIIFAHLGYKDLNNIWLDNEIGEQLEKKYLRNLDECKNNNIDMVVMHASIGWDTVEPNEIGLKRYQRICDYADKLGIKVAFENTKMKGYLEYLLKNIKNDNVGICFDSGHYHCHFKDDFDFSLFKDKIFCVHIHDNYGKIDDHLLPYDGTLDYSKVINGLKSANYKGYTTLEICYRMNYVDKISLNDFYIKGYKIGEELDKLLKEEK